jgi:hypothetical protein
VSSDLFSAPLASLRDPRAQGGLQSSNYVNACIH